VVRTRVGYAGGTSQNPTYYNLDGHSETIQIDYDPTRITYEELLDVFWDSHNPTVLPWSQQYMSIIFYHNDEQRRLATESQERVEAALGKKVVTVITPFSAFYQAEDYHQKYYLRQDPVLMQDLRAIYPDAQDFTDSTAAARLNGYVGGYGDPETLEAELSSYGLSEAGQTRLLELVTRGLAPGCPLP
jgi:peptide-methionine (S)-S-oxide reductase